MEKKPISPEALTELVGKAMKSIKEYLAENLPEKAAKYKKMIEEYEKHLEKTTRFWTPISRFADVLPFLNKDLEREQYIAVVEHVRKELGEFDFMKVITVPQRFSNFVRLYNIEDDVLDIKKELAELKELVKKLS